MNDRIVDGGAMLAVEGHRDEAHHLAVQILAGADIVELALEPQRSAFNRYRVAFRENEADPNLAHAAALVRAWNVLAEIMGLDPL